MRMLRPKEMDKIRVVGPKKRLEKVIDKLHDLEVIHFDEEDSSFGSGEPYPVAEEFSQLLVKTRSILSKLPVVGKETKDEGRDISEIEMEVEKKFSEMEELEEELEEEKNRLERIKKLKRAVPEDILSGYENISVLAGEVQRKGFEDELPEDSYEVFEDDGFIVVFIENSEKKNALKTLRNYGFREIRTEDILEEDFDVDEAESDIESMENRIQEINSEIENFGEKWGGYLEENRKDFEEKLEKAEAPIKFSTTDSAFIGEGWVPSEKFGSVKNELENITGGRIHVERVDDADMEEAPVEYDHPKVVKPFESLLEMYSPPKYTEIDPTFILSLTFPLFYGLMLSDFGYGLLTFAIFAGLRFKGTDFDSMLDMMIYASVSTMVFGLLGGAAFGVPIFGPESVFGGVFSSMPIILDYQKDVMTIMVISLILGVVQLNLGILIGFYNNLKKLGFKEALLKNGSWLFFEAGLALFGTNFAGVTSVSSLVPSILAVAGAGMYLSGEGALGALDLVLVLTDVLSYIRLMALGIATVSIATVINLIAGILFELGFAGILFGTLLLIGGHVFNIAFQVLGSSLHSLRLNFVEFFDRFYEGGGEKFKPFGKN